MNLSFAVLEPTSIALGVTGLLLTGIGIAIAVRKQYREEEEKSVAGIDKRISQWFIEHPHAATVEHLAAELGLTINEVKDSVIRLDAQGRVKNIGPYWRRTDKN
ncbi:MAG: hypothetical protein ACRD20_02265 [Terriglobales bacterium]